MKGVLGVEGAWDWLEMVWKRVETEELESGPSSFFQRACWKGEQRSGALHGEENEREVLLWKNENIEESREIV